MNYTILTSILELLNSSFDNHNNVKFGENFAENLSRHFVFLRFTLLYRNKILVSLLHLDPDPDIMIPYDLYADSVKLPSYHTGHFTVYNTRIFIQENTMKKKWKFSLMTSTWHFSGVATLKHCLQYFLKTVIFPMQIPNRVCAKTFHYA